MITLLKTSSENSDFRAMVTLLDRELAIRDGDDHSFYAQYNKIDHIHHAMVAYYENSAVGCGAFKYYEEGVVEIKRMYVAENERGKGIAMKILTELENWAFEIGNTQCVLETGKKQPEAIRLYVKSGYIIIPNYGQYKNVENSVCMKKQLGQ